LLREGGAVLGLGRRRLLAVLFREAVRILEHAMLLGLSGRGENRRRQ